MIKSRKNIKGRKAGGSFEGKVTLVLSVAAFLCSFIFLSGSITGNTILNSSVKSSNIVGALLFIVGVAASFFYFERRK